jgi:UDP-glucuronate 4-epimerase
VGIDNLDPFYSPTEKRNNLAVALQHEAFRLIEADCTDLAALETALVGEDFEVVAHMAAKGGVRQSIGDPLGYARANVLGTQTVLELLRRRGIGRLVFGSSSSVYGDSGRIPFTEDDPADRPISPYAATKRAGELLCHASHHLHGISTIVLRFFTVYGPRQRPDLAIRTFGTKMLRGEPISILGDGTAERDYTWIDDIIEGTVASVRRTGQVPCEFEIMNLGGNHPTTLARLIELLSSALETEYRTVRLPAQPGDVQRTLADIRKASRLIDYHPRTPIEVGIPRFAEWLLSSWKDH